MKIRDVKEVKKELENPKKRNLANIFDSYEKDYLREKFLAPLGNVNHELRQYIAWISDIKQPTDCLNGIYYLERQLEAISKKAAIANVLSSIDSYAPNAEEKGNNFIKSLAFLTATSTQYHKLKLNYHLNVSKSIEELSRIDNIDYLKHLRQRDARDAVKRMAWESKDEAETFSEKLHGFDLFLSELVFYENDGLFLYLLFFDDTSKMKEILPTREQFIRFHRAWEEFESKEIARIYLLN